MAVYRYHTNTEDKFSKFLGDLHGTILITRNYDALDARRGLTEVPMIPLRAAINARLVLGSDKERPKFYVSVKAMDEWCAKNDMTPSAFRRQLTGANLLRVIGDQGKGFDKKISLGRGVPQCPTAQCRCMEIEYAAAHGYVEEFVGSNVVSLHSAVPNSVPEEETTSEEAAVTA